MSKLEFVTMKEGKETMGYQGKLIAVYGINRTGKSTQTRMLVDRLGGMPKVERIKYPIYDLRPTGPLINEYLREDNPHGFTPREAQFLYVQNRLDFDSVLQRRLMRGVHVVAEDYWGTGVAWGAGAGVDSELLITLNKGLFKEDLAILLDGEQFATGHEEGHRHEDDLALTEKVREIHLDLARRFRWHTVSANRSPEEVHEDVYGIVNQNLFSGEE